jgi:hypothetical protein
VGLLEADLPMIPALRDYNSRSKKRSTIS